MERFEDPKRTIHVPADETFAVALSSNLTSGYTWELDVDSSRLEVIGETYEADTRAVGASGKQVFRLRARSRGETRIVCKYHRPWEDKPRDQRELRVVAE
ncbi:MAG: protease inhibitor I42 family protein [Anaerolineae bacterium]|jgi:inhibitor of cysteine peptidase